MSFIYVSDVHLALNEKYKSWCGLLFKLWANGTFGGYVERNVGNQI